jgi:lipopolysaccharide transport system ATP-binding protein
VSTEPHRAPTDREWQLGISGTFDVANYGDLLFPLIAEAELGDRLGRVRLHRFSYCRRTPPDWPYEVQSLADLPEAAGGLDGFVVGGGHLIRFDEAVAPGYGPPTPDIHHPTGLWLSPALMALERGLPVAWNAVGVHGPIPPWAEPLMRLAIGASSYVAVRDEPSRRALRPFAAGPEVTLVPDTAFGIERLVDLRRPSAELRRLRETLGLTGRYVVVQATRGLETFSRFARAHPHLFGECRLLSLPIGPVLGDDDARLGSDLPGIARLPRWPSPLLLAELVGQAVAVVGASLHLSITALAFGVPVFRPAGSDGGKYAILSEFDGVAFLPSDGEIDPRWFEARLGRGPVSPHARAALGRLSVHWDHMAAALTGGPNPRALPALGRLWQSLPGVRENPVDRRPEAVADHAPPVADRDREIRALRRNVAALQGPWSWKLTAPLRALRRWLRQSGGVNGES